MGSISTRITKRVFLVFTIFIFDVEKYSLEAKIVKGLLWTHENWKFVARFCFRNHHGKYGGDYGFNYDVRYDEKYAVQNIDLYYDTPEQWTRVYGRRADLTDCRQKESVLQVS